VEEIVFDGFESNVLSSLSNVKNASYVAMKGVSIDLAPFQHIEKGAFCVTRRVNYHLLTKLQSLTLSDCQSVTDVSCFQNIPDLDLHYCRNITDVSPLSRVHTLNLSCCDGFTDVSSLRNVHTLVLNYCENLMNISGLENVYSLSFCGFRGRMSLD
jgi:hypothetical protein